MPPYLSNRPTFVLVGELSTEQSDTINAIEELFQINILILSRVTPNSTEEIIGYIVHMPNRLQDLNPALLEPFEQRPVLFLGITKKDIPPLSKLINSKLSQSEDLRTKYDFSDEFDPFGPFMGYSLSEENSGVNISFHAVANVELLISSGSSWVYGRIENRYVCSAPLAGIWNNHGLRHEFCYNKFMGLLPLFTFLREFLKEKEFKPQSLRACCIIDDPNLRSMKYGYLDYNKALESTRQKNYHMGIGLIPIDYKKVNDSVTKLFRDNTSRLSIVMHGIDHLFSEMAIPSSEDSRRKRCEQGLWRMDRFQDNTGLNYARAIVLPHGMASREMILTMRKTGFQALIASRSYPFKDKDDAPLPLYQMFPSENNLEGFPIINRFPWTYRSWDELLFFAWLGKPIIPYSHHQLFRNGYEKLNRKIDFINRWISPEWSNIPDLLLGNYTTAIRNGHFLVNIHSNVLNIRLPDDVSEFTVTKWGSDLPYNEEIIMVNGERHYWATATANCLSAEIPVESVKLINIELIPERPYSGETQNHVNLKAVIRRNITELRDRIAPFLNR